MRNSVAISKNAELAISTTNVPEIMSLVLKIVP
jgi:hypothetical protein